MVDTLGLVNAVTGAPSYNGRKLRQLNGVGFAGATTARPLGVRSGVRPGTSSTTVTATSGTWTVQPHAGLIDGQTAVEAGGYPFAFDAVATGAVAAASGSFARVDIVYDQIDDPSESDGSTVPAVTRKYLAGLVANTPQALPARSILLAHINVPISGGGSPTVTWKAPYCAAAGAVVDFNTKAEMDAVLTLPVGAESKIVGSAGRYLFSGTAWAREPRFVTRAFTVATDASGLGVITHTLGEIPDGVHMQLQNYSGDDLKSLVQDAVVWGGLTSTSVTYRFRRQDTNAWFGVNSFVGWLTVFKN